jgi:hypothetical protein
MPKPTPESPILLTRQQVARMLGVRVAGLRNLEKRGQLVRFRRDHLDAGLARLAGGEPRGGDAT